METGYITLIGVDYHKIPTGRECLMPRKFMLKIFDLPEDVINKPFMHVQDEVLDQLRDLVLEAVNEDLSNRMN